MPVLLPSKYSGKLKARVADPNVDIKVVLASRAKVSATDLQIIAWAEIVRTAAWSALPIVLMRFFGHWLIWYCHASIGSCP